MTELKNSFSLSRPVTVLFLGACPAMALTANVLSALAIGLATLLVMLLSDLVLGLLRGVTGGGFLAKLVVISFFASVAGLLMHAFLPNVYQLMGIYLAVLAVSLPAFDSAETTEAKGLGKGLADAIVTGLGFTLALCCMAVVREVLGSGSFAGAGLSFMQGYTVPILTQAPGGLLVFAILLAVLNRLCAPKAAAEPANE